MDTTTNTQHVGGSRVGHKQHRMGRYVRKVLTGAALAAVAVTGIGVAMAPPASAATEVSYCFVTADGRPAGGINTTFWVWYNNGYYRIGTSRTGSTGCDRVDTRGWSNYYIRVSAGSFMDRGVRYEGYTPLWAPPGYGSAHLGTGVATMYW